MSHAPLYAAIDLGSNSFHMLVVQEVSGTLRTLVKVKRKVRLAAGLDANNQLDMAAIERGLACLRLFAEQLQDIPATHVRIVGTATLRLASNVNQFLAQAEAILGHPIEIISGEEEAKTIYEGVHWTSAGEGNRLVIDIGGASTELVIGEGSQAKLLNSLNMGCVTWLNRYFGDGILSEERFSAAIAGAKELLAPVVNEYRKLGFSHCVGASGTVQTLQKLMLAQGENELVTLAKLYNLRQQAVACQRLDTLNLQGLSSELLTVFPSGLAILTAIFELFEIESMTLAGGALREGLIYGLLDNQPDRDARQRTVASLLQRYQIDAEHGEVAQQAALTAFDQLQASWRLSRRYARPMLGFAALLHELGLCIDYKRAPHHAAYIIDNIDMPGFTPAQKRLLAALLLNQRDEFSLEPLSRQGAVSGRQALHLVRILRLVLILALRRSQEAVPPFRFSSEGEQLRLNLPRGWLEQCPLRAAALHDEVARQREEGWVTLLDESDLLD